MNPLTTNRFTLAIFSSMVGLSVTTPSTSRHSWDGPHGWQKGKLEQLVIQDSLHMLGKVTTLVEAEKQVSWSRSNLSLSEGKAISIIYVSQISLHLHTLVSHSWISWETSTPQVRKCIYLLVVSQLNSRIAGSVVTLSLRQLTRLSSSLLLTHHHRHCFTTQTTI